MTSTSVQWALFHTRVLFPLFTVFLFVCFFQVLTDSLPNEAAWQAGMVLLFAREETSEKKDIVGEREEEGVDADISNAKGRITSPLPRFKYHIQHCSNNAFDTNTVCLLFFTDFSSLWVGCFGCIASSLEKTQLKTALCLFYVTKKAWISITVLDFNEWILWTLLIILEFREICGIWNFKDFQDKYASWPKVSVNSQTWRP